MKPRGQFTVTEFPNNSTTSWRVQGTTLDGKRIRENYATQLEAEGRKQELDNARLNFKPDHRMATTKLSPEQLTEAEMAYMELGEKSMLDAIRFYLENHYEPANKITVKDALVRFVEYKAKKGRCRPATVANLKSRVGLLVARFGEKLVSDILPGHIKELLDRPDNHVTADNDRRAFSSFFSWCIEQEFCGKNPAKKQTRSKPNGDEEEPHILSLAQVRRLLAAAESYKDGKLIPYVTLALFAAIRPTEVARLKWENIDLQEGTITIGPKIAKLRQRRMIEMARLVEHDKDNERILPPNLVEWLAPHAIKHTPIKGSNWRRDFDAIKVAAGLVKLVKEEGKQRKKVVNTGWDQDVLRHTGISHHFALFKHEGKTAEWAGNSPVMIHRHYKGLVKPAEPAEFFGIKPGESATKIIQLPNAQAAS